MSVPVAVCPILCKHAFFFCLCVCECVEERRARSEVPLMLMLLPLLLLGSLWLSVKRGQPRGALLQGPDKASAGLSPPGTKCAITMRKTCSSSPEAEDCQARWRGRPPLISCREALNAGRTLTSLHAHTRGHNGRVRT